MKAKIEYEGEVRFHGGCHGCTQQDTAQSYDVCERCQYMEPDWSKRDMNNRAESKSDRIRRLLLGN